MTELHCSSLVVMLTGVRFRLNVPPAENGFVRRRSGFVGTRLRPVGYLPGDRSALGAGRQMDQKPA
jgi:hypothetical protein